MPFENEEARFRLGLLPGEDLPDIACAMLEAGFDSQPLRELAGLHRPTLRDSAELFEAAIEALGRPPLTAGQAKYYLRRQTLAAVASRDVPPLEGAHRLWRVWNDTGQPDDLSVFIYLDDLWQDYPDRRDAIEEEIVATAAAILASEPSPPSA